MKTQTRQPSQALSFDTFVVQVGQELRDGYGVELDSTCLDETRLLKRHAAGMPPETVVLEAALESGLVPMNRQHRLRRAA